MSRTDYVLNAGARRVPSQSGLFDAGDYHQVASFFESPPDLEPTPLRHLRTLASTVHIADILIKDEAFRFGLNAFKVLGVSYAVDRLIRTGRLDRASVLACASSGNHGRAVARTARDRELRARIYLPAGTVPARVEAIAHDAAHVVVTDGSYDAAVRQAAAEAADHGWTVVSDISWPGYEEIPHWIMAGYTELLSEALEQWAPNPAPDVVLVQAGVGGLLCAITSWLCWKCGTERPFVIACAATSAPCLLESLRSGRRVAVPVADTIMAGLRCGEVSFVAWPIIAASVDACVTVDDERAREAVRGFARPLGRDPAVAAGASGACGLAALLAVLEEDHLRPVREASRLGPHSRVLLINTEGVTDPELHASIVDRS